MGQQHTIAFDAGGVPAWDAVRDQLARLGVSAAVKMIDGLPAFPDEIPEPGWKELRLGVSSGMVTLRADGATLSCVVWGNADTGLRAFWDALGWACAAAGNGLVETPEGRLSAAEFARAAGLRPA